jgi:Tfp pilus assembly protein PilZ
LSGLGFRISTNEALVSGKEVFIRAHIASEVLNLKAKVMWINEMNVPGGEKYLAGIKILDTPIHDESKFIKFFAKQLLELSKCKVIYPF